ncbi:hypothetical protein AVEN_154390-1, partial [Araneus ventricosus]
MYLEVKIELFGDSSVLSNIAGGIKEGMCETSEEPTP